MCPKYHEYSHIGSREDASVMEEKKEVYSCPSSLVTSLQLSTNVNNTMPESSEPNFVYSRRKIRGNTGTGAVFSAQNPASPKRSGEECVSVVSSSAPSVKEQHLASQGEHAVEDPDMPYAVRKGESCVLKAESINGCLLVEERVSDQASKNTERKIIEVDSMNDSCSSSKSDMELASASMHAEVEDTSECSSSSAMVREALGEDLSETDLCASIIKRKGALEGVWPSTTHGSSECVGHSSNSSISRFCKICAHLESPSKMLICDNCEAAFHLSCCNPRVKKIPQDEWFCHSCSKKRRKILTESISKRVPNMIGEKGRCRNFSIGESNPIALMLRDTGPYVTGVRIGKGFQAEVPDWSGPIADDVDTRDQDLEMGPSEFVISTEFKSCKPHNLSPIGNWLQCREITDDGIICGKWRRAPLFEVQTDDWECFCSVIWDPFHADCAVPQELDTEEVLKQLKYIQMLRPRLDAKRRKLDCMNHDDDSTDNIENARNVRTRK